MYMHCRSSVAKINDIVLLFVVQFQMFVLRIVYSIVCVNVATIADAKSLNIGPGIEASVREVK